MIIDISHAVEGEFYTIEETLTLNNSMLGSREGRFTAPATIKGWYTVMDDNVAMNFEIKANAVFNCDSCLSPAYIDFKIPVSETFFKEKVDVDSLVYEDEQIDLMPVINERIVLAVPSRVLCKNDCKGMCDRCGQNYNEGTCNCNVNNRENDNNPFAVLKKI